MNMSRREIYAIDAALTPFNIEDDVFEVFLDRIIEEEKLVISQRDLRNV